MGSGYAAIAGRVNWVEARGVFDTLPFRGETIVPLPMVNISHLPGFRCAACSVVLLGYDCDEPEEVLGPR